MRRTTIGLDAANRTLAAFAPESRIERRSGGYWIGWTTARSELWRRWQIMHGQSFYAPWNRLWPHGGTAMVALSQLIRALQGRPVLPIGSWRYWARQQLLAYAAVDELLAAGYPEHAECVLCHDRIEGGLDWWDLDRVSGPCCGWTTGCRQRV